MDSLSKRLAKAREDGITMIELVALGAEVGTNGVLLDDEPAREKAEEALRLAYKFRGAK